jgi:low affinity Fe/Cu permease
VSNTQNHRTKSRHSLFTSFANHTAKAAGHPLVFAVAMLAIVGWAISGPVFGFSDTWQLVINTSTTIITFLMVFLIQNTQNRDSTAMHLKLDEVIRALDGAHNTLLNLEDLEDHELEVIHKRYVTLAERARDALVRDGVENAAAEIEEIGEIKRGTSARDAPRAERRNRG